uniref:Uncharacterized protein n=1 Tax=Romanomermis culicivorax TaxID=13658 RepID=A0A915HLE9_ROMCU
MFLPMRKVIIYEKDDRHFSCYSSRKHSWPQRAKYSAARTLFCGFQKLRPACHPQSEKNFAGRNSQPHCDLVRFRDPDLKLEDFCAIMQSTTRLGNNLKLKNLGESYSNSIFV